LAGCANAALRLSSSQICFSDFQPNSTEQFLFDFADHSVGGIKDVANIVFHALPEQGGNKIRLKAKPLQPFDHLRGCMLQGLLQRTGVADFIM